MPRASCGAFVSCEACVSCVSASSASRTGGQARQVSHRAKADPVRHQLVALGVKKLGEQPHERGHLVARAPPVLLGEREERERRGRPSLRAAHDGAHGAGARLVAR